MHRSRARAIFTNDAECDDMNSFIHLLLYANDIDIDGLVLSSSRFHYAGDPSAGIEPFRWAGGEWMWDYLDAYEQVYPNLVVHDPSYPTADQLRSVTCVGNVKTTGCMDEDSEGSELIRRAILRDDPCPIWLLAGGGTNTIARALKGIEERWRDSPAWGHVYRKVCDRTRIYMIVTQDDTYRDYICHAWPDLPLLHSTNMGGIAFLISEGNCPPDALALMKGAWLKPHLLDKGPLLAHYHSWGDGHVYPGEQDRSQFGSNPRLMGGAWWGREPHGRYDMISEGDSPSFLHLVDTGLRSLEDPGFGGWGGRFERKVDNEFNPAAAYWCSAPDEDRGPTRGDAYQFSRWTADWMREFACRAQWCVTGRYEDANHAPHLDVVEGDNVTARPGERVALHARASDPDGDALDYDWFRYQEADTAPGGGEVLTSRDDEATVSVPLDARPAETIHVICRVRDCPAVGDDCLCAYRRVVVSVV